MFHGVIQAPPIRHSRERGNPDSGLSVLISMRHERFPFLGFALLWIPAFAGMTEKRVLFSWDKTKKLDNEDFLRKTDRAFFSPMWQNLSLLQQSVGDLNKRFL